MQGAVTVRAIGFKAHEALQRSDGRLAALAEFPRAPYARAGSEIVWIGAGDVAMHPRAVVLHDHHPGVTGACVLANAVSPWRPTPLSIGVERAVTLREGCARLHRDLQRIGEPRGLALLLAGRTPPFPLGASAPQVDALARAFRDADADAVHAAALPLLGLGPGLTPSGDDLVGAALFGRRAIVPSREAGRAWHDLALRLVDAARSRSHVIGAALFQDLVDGASFGPLHDLAAALGRGADDEESLAAARALTAIGHSSGWDMLAGFIIGISGALSPPRTTKA